MASPAVTAQILLARPAAEVGKRGADDAYDYKHLYAPALSGGKLRIFLAAIESPLLAPLLYRILIRKSNFPQV